MARIHSLLACIFLILIPQASKAATFAPDMWVYEITLETYDFHSGFSAFRDAKVAPGTEVPDGCHSEGAGSGGDFTIWCEGGPTLEEMMATADGTAWMGGVGYVAFNATDISCSGLWIRCPTKPVNEEFEVSYLTYFDRIVLDAVNGSLDYCVNNGEAIYRGCFFFSRGASEALIELTLGEEITGFWDFGPGGKWRSGIETYLYMSGSGRLISSPPSVVPLPAPILMLGAGLAVLGRLSLSRRRERTTGPEA